jgi:hypothetical protein
MAPGATAFPLKEGVRETGERFKETDRLLRQNQKMMDGMEKKFGAIIEHMFIPNLKEKFNASASSLKNTLSTRSSEAAKTASRGNVVFLENGDCALAVRMKTWASLNDVRDHVERTEKMRRRFDLHNDWRKLYGAVSATRYSKAM